MKRKGSIPTFNLWLTGQFESAEQSLLVGIERLHDGVGMFPDFAFFDCQSCHHSLKDVRWTKRRADGVLPGSLRLHMPNMVILDAVARALGSDDIRDEFTKCESEYNKFSATGQNRNLPGLHRTCWRACQQPEKTWAREFSNTEVVAVRRALLGNAASDRASDYSEAEQIYYSFESLCYTLNEYDRCASALDQLFESISDSDNHSPYSFSRLAKKLVGNF